HDVRDASITARHDTVGRPRTARPVSKTVPRSHYLADDLACRKIAHEPLRPRVAERTIERAADLTGHAQRAPLGVGDVNALNFVRPLTLHFARQTKQPLARTVHRNLLGDDLRPRKCKMLGQGRA